MKSLFRIFSITLFATTMMSCTLSETTVTETGEFEVTTPAGRKGSPVLVLEQGAPCHPSEELDVCLAGLQKDIERLMARACKEGEPVKSECHPAKIGRREAVSCTGTCNR